MVFNVHASYVKVWGARLGPNPLDVASPWLQASSGRTGLQTEHASAGVPRSRLRWQLRGASIGPDSSVCHQVRLTSRGRTTMAPLQSPKQAPPPFDHLQPSLEFHNSRPSCPGLHSLSQSLFVFLPFFSPHCWNTAGKEAFFFLSFCKPLSYSPSKRQENATRS